jgi:hypothetical protein
MVGNAEYFEDFVAWCSDPRSRRAYLDHLMSVDIQGVKWIRERPKTAAYIGMAAAIVRPEFRFLADKYFLGESEETTIPAKRMFEQYDVWRDQLGLDDAATKRSIVSFGCFIQKHLDGLGVAKVHTRAGATYIVDKKLLVEHLLTMGFGTTVDMHPFLLA